MCTFSEDYTQARITASINVIKIKDKEIFNCICRPFSPGKCCPSRARTRAIRVIIKYNDKASVSPHPWHNLKVKKAAASENKARNLSLYSGISLTHTHDHFCKQLYQATFIAKIQKITSPSLNAAVTAAAAEAALCQFILLRLSW